VAALDRVAELTPDVRPLRAFGQLPAAGPRRRAGLRRPGRPRLRRLVPAGLAEAVRRPDRRVRRIADPALRPVPAPRHPGPALLRRRAEDRGRSGLWGRSGAPWTAGNSP